MVLRSAPRTAILAFVFGWLGSSTVLAAAEPVSQHRTDTEPGPGSSRLTDTHSDHPAAATTPRKGGPSCSLSATQLEARRDELLPGFIERAESVAEIRHGLRLRFSHQPGLMIELAGLIEQEQTCCGFLRFRLITSEGTGPVTLEVRGPRGTTALLRRLRQT